MAWTDDQRAVIKEFLDRSKALLATNEFTIQQSEKNKAFQKKYNLTSGQQKEILKSLSVEDCIEYGPNNNPRYPDATVFKFIKEVNLLSFGEPEQLEIYIKEYLLDNGQYEVICVISLHEEGLHDD